MPNAYHLSPPRHVPRKNANVLAVKIPCPLTAEKAGAAGLLQPLAQRAVSAHDDRNCRFIDSLAIHAQRGVELRVISHVDLEFGMDPAEGKPDDCLLTVKAVAVQPHRPAFE